MTRAAPYMRAWLREVDSQSRRFSVLFTQLGYAYAPARLELAGLPGRHLTCREYVGGGANLEEQPPVQGLIVLKDVECLVDGRSITLGQMRAKVMEDLDAGHRFLLVSSRARSCFPSVPGSSLLEDAKVVVGPTVPVGERVDQRGVASLPVYAPLDGHDEGAVMRAMLAELDPELLAALEYVCWECSASPTESLELLSGSDLMNLRTSGFVQFDNGEHRWVVQDAWRDFRVFLADAVMGLTAAPNGVEVMYRELWEIERTLRLLVGEAARAKSGDHWRKSLFSEAEKERICENARRDTHPEVKSVAELRDPLEWLTFSELLDLRANKGLGDLGVPNYFWPKIGGELVPIRNRVAHTRIPRSGDRETVKKWHKILCKSRGR